MSPAFGAILILWMARGGRSKAGSLVGGRGSGSDVSSVVGGVDPTTTRWSSIAGATSRGLFVAGITLLPQGRATVEAVVDLCLEEPFLQRACRNVCILLIVPQERFPASGWLPVLRRLRLALLSCLPLSGLMMEKQQDTGEGVDDFASGESAWFLSSAVVVVREETSMEVSVVRASYEKHSRKFRLLLAPALSLLERASLPPFAAPSSRRSCVEHTYTSVVVAVVAAASLSLNMGPFSQKR